MSCDSPEDDVDFDDCENHGDLIRCYREAKPFRVVKVVELKKEADLRTAVLLELEITLSFSSNIGDVSETALYRAGDHLEVPLVTKKKKLQQKMQ